MSVSLAMIVRDGIADGVDVAVASARPYVDEVCILDTGSTDGTLELLHKLASKPGAPIRIERAEWRDDFSWARNQSAAMASSEWLLWLDANDSLVGGDRLADVVARAEAAQADIAWVFWDRYERTQQTSWWPSIVRAGTGHWQGVVHECWRRPGIDRWKHGVGQAGSVYVHPAALRVLHRDRTETPFKYLGLLDKAARDPERTPWALAGLAEELRRIDDRRVVDLLEQHLRGGYDRIEGAYSALHASTLQNIADAHERLGNLAAAQQYRGEWDAYTRTLTRELGEHAAFLLQLGDVETVQAWVEMKPKAVDLLLEPPKVATSVIPMRAEKIGRNDPCPCGSGKKYKKCHGAA